MLLEPRPFCPKYACPECGADGSRTPAPTSGRGRASGRVECFHRSTRQGGLEAEELRNPSEAREVIGRWVKRYNEERLHAALGDLPPAEYDAGDPAARREERRKKLEEAKERREAINHQRQLDAAA